MLEFTNEDDLAQAFAAKTTALYESLFEKVNQLDSELEAKAKAKASGDVLQIRTGELVQSIQSVPADLDGDEIMGYVQASAPYAGFQEYGTKGPYEIKPVSKQALAFLIGNKQIFARKVIHPGLPERSFLRSSLDEMRGEIFTSLGAAVSQ